MTDLVLMKRWSWDEISAKHKQTSNNAIYSIKLKRRLRPHAMQGFAKHCIVCQDDYEEFVFGLLVLITCVISFSLIRICDIRKWHCFSQCWWIEDELKTLRQSQPDNFCPITDLWWFHPFDAHLPPYLAIWNLVLFLFWRVIAFFANCIILEKRSLQLGATKKADISGALFFCSCCK